MSNIKLVLYGMYNGFFVAAELTLNRFKKNESPKIIRSINDIVLHGYVNVALLYYWKTNTIYMCFIFYHIMVET